MLFVFRSVFGLALVCGFAFITPVFGQEEATLDPAPAESAKPEDLFAVPQSGKAADLVAFINRLVRQKVEAKDEVEREEYFKKVATALLEATGLTLAIEDLTEEDAELALSYRFQAFELQRQLAIKGIDKLELQLAEKYSKDKRRTVGGLARKVLITARLRNAKDLPASDQEALLEETIASLQPDGKPSNQSVRAAMEIGRVLEESGNSSLAAQSYEKFADSFTLTKNEELVALARKFKGMAARLKLPGNPIEIVGTQIDGQPFDLTSYQGKVVLIDFWATWCGPCVAEIPNIKQNYSKYHSKGFEVVGISLDEEAETVQNFLKKNKIPWKTLFSDNPDAFGVENPLAVKYGVLQIPCMILVGKNGKVISTSVRGPQLSKLLLEQLGPPAESPDAKAENPQSKKSETNTNPEK